jgi:anti-sigma B factor antagonist
MPSARYPIEMIKGVPVVIAPEEIDATNADSLRALLLQAACAGQGTFVVDLTRTQFCGSAGINVLVAAHNRARAEGGELRLVIPASAMVWRVFAVTDIDHLIPNFPTLDEALQPAQAATPRRRKRPRRPKPGMRTPTARQRADPGAAPSPG